MSQYFGVAPINFADMRTSAGTAPQAQPEEQGLFGNAVDAAQMGAANTVGGILDFVGADGLARSFRKIGGDQINQMSESGRQSMSKDFFTRDSQGDLALGDAATDLDAWILNLASAAGGLAVTLPTGGALGAATKTGSMIGMGATGGAAATGMQADQARQEIFRMDDNLLRESPKYGEIMQLVDQQYADASLEEKHQIAKASIAEMVANEVKSDPKTLLANFAGSALADPLIGKALTGARIAKGGIKASAAKGFAAEGLTETGQAGTSQYAMNEILQPFDNRDTMAGVVEQGLTEGLLGGTLGAGIGAAGGAINREPAVKVTKGAKPVENLTSSDALNKALNDLENNTSAGDIILNRPAATAMDRPDEQAAAETASTPARDYGLFDEPTIARQQYGVDAPTDLGRVGDNLLFGEQIANAQAAPTVQDLLRQAPAQAAAERQAAQDAESVAAVRAAFGDVTQNFRDINTGASPVQQALQNGQAAPDSARLVAEQMAQYRQQQADKQGEEAAQATSAAFADAADKFKFQQMPAQDGELLPPESRELVPTSSPIRTETRTAQPGSGAVRGADGVFYADQKFEVTPDAAPNQPRALGYNGTIQATDQSGVLVKDDGTPFASEAEVMRDPRYRMAVENGDPVRPVPFGDGYGIDTTSSAGRLNVRASGQPFATEAQALASTAARTAVKQSPIEAVAVDGGFGWRQATQQPATTEQSADAGDFSMADVERVVEEMEAEADKGDGTPPSVSKPTKAALTASPEYKDAVKWALDKDYVIEVKKTAEGWSFEVKKSEPVKPAADYEPVKASEQWRKDKVEQVAKVDGVPASMNDVYQKGDTVAARAYGLPEVPPPNTNADVDELTALEDELMVPDLRYNAQRALDKKVLALVDRVKSAGGNWYLVQEHLLKDIVGVTNMGIRQRYVDRALEEARRVLPKPSRPDESLSVDDVLNGNISVIQYAESRGVDINEDKHEKALWDIDRESARYAEENSAYGRAIQAVQKTISDELDKASKRWASTPQERKSKDAALSKWQRASSYLYDRARSFENPFNNSYMDQLPALLKQRHQKLFEGMRFGDSLRTENRSLRYKRYAQKAAEYIDSQSTNPKFRKEAVVREPVESSLSTRRAQQVVDDVLSKLGDLRGITVKVVLLQSDVEAEAGPVVDPATGAEWRVKGYYNPANKEVVLITENIANATEVRTVLTHELLAHGGLDMVLGKDATLELLNKIAKTRNVPAFKSYWAAADKNYPELDDIGKAEEIFAKFVEKAPEPGPLRYWWNNFVNTLRRMLNNAGLWTSDMTKADMEDALKAIRDGFREKRATINTSTTTRATRNEVRQAAETGRLSDAGAVRRRQDSLAEDSGQKPGDQSASGKTSQSERESDGSLKGLPRRVKLPNGQQIYAKHFKPAADAAKAYMESKGLRYAPHSVYAKADPERAVRIAAAYDMMADDPFNPEVRAAYDAMAKETLEQFQFALDAGLVVEFFPTDSDGNIVDPYPDGPRMATEDVVNNNHLYVYPTADGYGDAGVDPDAAEVNPMLADSGFKFGSETALVNDVFRAVHDYFGHVKEGVGFRADGEENAWQSHAAMYSPLARRAMTTETRGQNSWLNYGPYGDKNRSAKVEDTTFADQKIGLLPDWVMEEGALWNEPGSTETRPESTEPKPKLSKTRNYETMATPEVDAILAKAHSGIMDKARDALKGSGVWDKLKANWTAALTLSQLAEVSAKLFPGGAMKDYNDVYQQYVADVQSAATDASFIANDIQQWASGNKEEADAMFETAHDATIYGIDADPKVSGDTPLPLLEQKLLQLRDELNDAIADGTRPREVTSLRKEIKAVKAEIEDFADDVYTRRRAELQERFNALSPEAQKHYRDLRKSYERRRQEAFSVQRRELDRMAERAKADGNSAAYAATMKARRRLSMEQKIANLSGPYFPLTRFGDYFTDLKRPDGERVFLMHESESEMSAAVKAFEEAGWSVERKGKTQEFMKEDGMSSEVMDALGKIVENSDLEPDQVDGLKDQMFQLYLQYLPTRSIRKNLIHRKNVRGFSQDAVRAFALSMSKSSNQIARLKHMPAFTQALRDVNGQVRDYERSGDAGDAVKSRYLLEELRKRHENIMNPSESKVSQAITGLGFTWLLGLSPAAAVINLTQTATIAAPVMAAKLNISLPKALALMTRELKNMKLSTTRSGERLITLRDSDEVKNDPILRAAYNRLERMGVIDLTRAHDLVGISETGGFQYGGKFHKAMSFVSKFFHNAEVINREITAIAIFKQAYNANLSNGMTEQDAMNDAIKTAAELTRQSHFDYSSGNRARFMQGNVAKVAFQFKQYSQQMTYYLIRNAWRSLPWGDLTKQERKEARAQLFGTLMSTGFIGGLSALPLSALYAIINMVVPDDEDDKPFDAKQEFYTFLAQNVGKDLANTVIYGAGGAGLSTRIQLNDLWLRDPSKNLEGAAAYGNYVMQLLGPVAGGIIPNMVQGASLIDEGKYQKGIEKMIPKAFKDVSVTERYADEGATNLRGDVIKQDFDFFELFLQANGLADSEVTARYEENAALKGVEDAIKKRRQSLMDKYFDAVTNEDQEALNETLEAIDRFNEKNPTIRLSTKSLRQSMRTRQKRTEETKSGLYLDKNLRYLEEQIDWL